MTDFKVDVEYKINLDGNYFLLDSKQYQLLESILDSGSLTKSAKTVKISYRTILNILIK